MDSSSQQLFQQKVDAQTRDSTPDNVASTCRSSPTFLANGIANGIDKKNITLKTNKKCLYCNAQIIPLQQHLPCCTDCELWRRDYYNGLVVDAEDNETFDLYWLSGE
jgi:hypothetical protein